MVKDWTLITPQQGMAAQSDGFTVPRSERQPIYHAGGQGRRLHMWRPPASGPNVSVTREQALIRSRTRAAARNDPWAGAILDKLDSNGIATGIQAKMVNGSDALKKASKQVWNRFIKEVDADGGLDWYGLQLLAWHEWHEVGEVFARFRTRRPSDGLAVPFQVQLIESEQCPADLYTTASNGNPVRAGVEFNLIGKRVAYWFWKEHPGDTMFFNRGNEYVRVPAEEVIHLYRPLRAGQIRGLPDSVSVLLRMFNLDSLDDAVLERQKIANLFTLFYTRKTDPENPESLIDEMSYDEDGDQDLDDDDVPLAGLEPGTGQELPDGVEPKFSNPPAPSADLGEFYRMQLLAICARNGVPYEVVTGDLRNISDRALKLILNEFKRTIEMRQWLTFIPKFCQPVRTRFFDMSWMSNALVIPDYAEQRPEIVDTLWVPQGWPYSHPVQDVSADIKAIRAGLDTRSDVNLRNGEDPEELDRRNAEDNERADKLGLVYDSDGRKTSGAGLTQARPAGTEIPPTDVKKRGADDVDDDEDDEESDSDDPDRNTDPDEDTEED
jgi:lambda family phage portal protein